MIATDKCRMKIDKKVDHLTADLAMSGFEANAILLFERIFRNCWLTLSRLKVCSA